MRQSGRKILFSFLLTVSISLFSLDSFSQEKIRWYTIEQAEKLASQNPKKIFIDVYTDWCGWCKKMDATTYEDPRIIKLLNSDFYAVRLDGEDKGEIVFKDKSYKYVPYGRSGYNELAAILMNGKLSYPTTVYLDEKLNMIQPIPGYQTVENLEPILIFLGRDFYKKQTWQEFLAQNYSKN
jgi:thioredoxin-related protein